MPGASTDFFSWNTAPISERARHAGSVESRSVGLSLPGGVHIFAGSAKDEVQEEGIYGFWKQKRVLITVNMYFLYAVFTQKIENKAS